MLKNNFAQGEIEKSLKADHQLSDVFILLGELNNTIVGSAIAIIADKLSIYGFSKSVISKSKLICIELLENITKHQVDEHTMSPYFRFSINDEFLLFTTGNCINEDESNYLSDTLESYKDLSTKDISAKYFEALKNGSLDESGNAGLGLLTILKRAQKKYEYQIDKISDTEYYFNSEVRIEHSNSIKKI